MGVNVVAGPQGGRWYERQMARRRIGSLVVHGGTWAYSLYKC